jgi:repressor LexA
MADVFDADLTLQQELILDCIRETIAATGEAPTVLEISRYVGMKSGSGVHYQLQQIEKKGAIIREPGRPRGIRLA